MASKSGKNRSNPNIKLVRVLRGLSPSQFLAVSIIALIFFGALLLSQPIASSGGTSTSFSDALFTSTSAVCVTGLVVKDTGTHFSLFGQIVIMLLIQIGGLGFMTTATLFAFLLRKRINLRERLRMQEELNQLTIEGVVRLAKMVLLTTFLIEGIGAVILTIRWWSELGFSRSLFYGLFHSVSAFNNAGFDLFGGFKSLNGYASDPVVNLVISFLIILGGIGFGVIAEVYSKGRWNKFSLHTKVVLSISLILTIAGTTIIFLLEYSNSQTLGHISLGGKLLAAWFQSVSARTAGYSTIDIGGMRSATQFILIILMFIGASPGSTGGGIKTSTMGTLWSAAWSVTKGKSDVEMFERRLPQEIVYRALTITLASIALVTVVTIFLSITENADFLTNLFEATSAFATAGLSMGLTTKLSFLGKIALILTMYAGRVGPLTLGFALAQKQEKPVYRFAEEKIIVG